MLSLATPTSGPLPRPPWWTHPDRFMACIILPFAILICFITPKLIATNQAGYDAPIFSTPFFVTLFLGGIVLIGIGALIGKHGAPPLPELRFRNGCLDALFWICMAAYVVWFGPLVASSPGLVMSALKAEAGAADLIRERAVLFSGVTTATQFGISYCCIFAAKRFIFGERMPLRYSIFFAAVILVAALRAVLYSERIALIEVLFPVVVMLCRGAWLTCVLVLRVFRQTVPILMVLGSPVFFTLFEFNRSWVSHYQYMYDSLMSFGLERLGIYYVTAFNNICGFFTHVGAPHYTGEETFRWLYRFPVVGDLLTQLVQPQFETGFMEFLDGLGIKEFNNKTGIMVVYFDWGVVGGALFLLAYGVLAGRAFHAYDRCRGFLQYFFPVILYSLFEILRIGYFFEGRCFAALIGLALAYVGWGQISVPHSPNGGNRETLAEFGRNGRPPLPDAPTSLAA